jgi:hypothetical protein
MRATILAVLQYPRVLFTPRVVAAARVWRGEGNAGRGASPRTGKREGFSFNLLLDLIDTSPLFKQKGLLDSKQGLDLIPKHNPNGPGEATY